MTKSKKNQAVAIDIGKLKNGSGLMRAVAHPLRLKLLAFIDKQKVTHVNKIYNTLGLEQSITSQHLKILRDNGIVHAKRDGKFIYYSVNYDKAENVVNVVNNYF